MPFDGVGFVSDDSLQKIDAVINLLGAPEKWCKGALRSHDGRLYKGRTGVARLALLSGAPVIPSAIIGTDIIAPPGKLITKIVSPTVKFGEPLDFSRYHGMSEDRFILRSITDEIMATRSRPATATRHERSRM